MKIAVVGVQGIPAKEGEIERYCQELYPEIVERGHQVDLFVRPTYHRQPWFSVYYYRQIRVIALASISHQGLNLFINSALSIIWATFSNYDVIHIQGIKSAWLSWFTQLFSPAKVIVTSHTLDCRPHLFPKGWRWYFLGLKKPQSPTRMK